MTTKIRIKDLDRSLQTRVETKAETVSDYAEAMRDGAKFPPVTVYRESKTPSRSTSPTASTASRHLPKPASRRSRPRS